MICAVVLAAGRSQRMGTQKLLLPFAGGTLIRHVVDQIAAGPVDRILVVVGRDLGAITAALVGRPVELVLNPAPDSEMLGSLRCGLRALPAGCRGVLACLGDQPGITPGLVDALVAAFDSSAGGVVAPVYEGRRGHPVLIGAEYRGRVLTRYDDTGLRGLLRDPEVEVAEVPWPTTLADLDCPEDYLGALRQWETRASEP